MALLQLSTIDSLVMMYLLVTTKSNIFLCTYIYYIYTSLDILQDPSSIMFHAGPSTGVLGSPFSERHCIPFHACMHAALSPGHAALCVLCSTHTYSPGYTAL